MEQDNQEKKIKIEKKDKKQKKARKKRTNKNKIQQPAKSPLTVIIEQVWGVEDLLWYAGYVPR